MSINVSETKDVISVIRDALTERRRDDALRLAATMFEPPPATIGELNRWMRRLMGELPKRSRDDALRALAGSSTFAVAQENARAVWLSQMIEARLQAWADALAAAPNEDRAFWLLPRGERSRIRVEHRRLCKRAQDFDAKLVPYGC